MSDGQTADELLASLNSGELQQLRNFLLAPDGAAAAAPQNLARVFQSASAQDGASPKPAQDPALSQSPQDPAPPQAAEAAAAQPQPEQKKSRSFLGAAFGAVGAAISGGFGAQAGMFLTDKARGNSHGLLDYLKVGAAGAAGAGVENLVAGEERGLLKSVAVGAASGAGTGVTIEMLSGKDPVTLLKAATGAVAGPLEVHLGSWLMDKALSTLGFGGDAPAATAQPQSAPVPA